VGGSGLSAAAAGLAGLEAWPPAEVLTLSLSLKEKGSAPPGRRRRSARRPASAGRLLYIAKIPATTYNGINLSNAGASHPLTAIRIYYSRITLQPAYEEALLIISLLIYKDK
jgi:hypothetical protein